MAARVDSKDERLVQSDAKVTRAQKRAQSVSYLTIPAESLDGSSLSYHFRTPNRETGVGRYLVQHVEGTITMDVQYDPDSADNWFYEKYEGAVVPTLRTWPLAGVTQQCSVTINNDTQNYGGLSQWVRAAEKIRLTTADGNRSLSGTASSPEVFNDPCAEQGRFQNNITTGEGVLQRGAGVEQAAAVKIVGYTCELITPPPVSFARITVAFSIDEPLVVPPFVVDRVDPPALYGVDYVRVSSSIANIEQIFHLLPWGINGAVNMTQQGAYALNLSAASLRVSFVKPHDICAKVQRVLISTPTLYSTSLNCSVAAPQVDANNQQTNPRLWSTVQVSSGPLQLTRVPKYAVVWASPPKSWLPNNDGNSQPSGPFGYLFASDIILPIRGCSVDVLDRTRVLSGAAAEQLYEISLKNGLEASQWSFLGSPSLNAASRSNKSGVSWQTKAFGYANSAPIVLDFAEDLDLPANVSPGDLCALNFNITCTVANNLGGSNFLLPAAFTQTVTLPDPVAPGDVIPVLPAIAWPTYLGWDVDSPASALSSVTLNTLFIYERVLVTAGGSTHVEG